MSTLQKPSYLIANLFVVLTVTFSAAGLAQSSQPPARRLSLKSATDALIAKNLTVLAARYNVDLFRAQRIAAALKPNRTVVFSVNQFTIPRAFTQPRSVYSTADAAANTTYTIDVEKTIERGGKRERRIGQADVQTQIAEAQLSDTLRQQTFELDVQPVSMRIEDLRQLALASRPDLHAAQLDLEAAEAGLKLAEAERVRDVTIGGQYARSGSDNTGIAVGVPLSTGPRADAAIAQATATKLQVEARLRQARAQVLTDVEKAFATVSVRCVLSNGEGRLKPGMFATVVLQSGTIQRAIIVPISTIRGTGDRRTVFVERERGTYQERLVQIGDEIAGSVVVKSGLREGERVVVQGSLLLSQQMAQGGGQ